MTPKEKAEYLIEFYVNIPKSINKYADFFSYEYAKKCALESIYFRISNCNDWDLKAIDYFKKVKQEIENL